MLGRVSQVGYTMYNDIYNVLPWGLDSNHWKASKDIHQGMPRCRFVGEKDSQDHAKGEGSLTYTNGDRFEVDFV